MKILCPNIKEFAINDIVWGLLKLGHEVENTYEFQKPISAEVYSEEAKKALSLKICQGQYELVMTYDFVPTVADACQENNTPYIAWVYDAPQRELYSAKTKYDTNYIFVFDKKQKERLQSLGISHLYHMPLAGNTDRVSGLVITPEDEVTYTSDISFVGSLYLQDYYQQTFDRAPEAVKKDMQKVIDSVLCCWQKDNHIYNSAQEETITYLQGCMDQRPSDKYQVEDRYFLEAVFFDRRIACLERIRALNLLAEQYRVRLYTGTQDTSALNGVEILPYVHYETEAPKVFFCSKINLNITMRSIESGVPQRIFDIMSVGGFVLSSYQPELEELFVPDKEIVLFHSLQELQEKVAYYLTHDRERIQIGINGYLRVKKDYNCETQLKKILEIVKADLTAKTGDNSQA